MTLAMSLRGLAQKTVNFLNPFRLDPDTTLTKPGVRVMGAFLVSVTCIVRSSSSQ
jgi:hypothetical protein